MMNLCENLKSAILRWSVCIPNAPIGDPSAVFNFIDVTCINIFKLISMFWYVEYLTTEMPTPESIRALHHLPTCTVMVEQSVMSTIVTSWTILDELKGQNIIRV